MFQKMKYILAVYEARGFTKAAEHLGISQPSLSASVKNVEQAVGAPLFERGFHPIRLTDAGRLYVETAMQLRRIEREFARRLEEQRDLNAGTLTLGGGSYVSSYVLPHLVRKFTERYPAITVTLVQDDSRSLRRALLEDEIDFAIDSYEFTDSVLERTPLFSEEILLAMPKSFPAPDAQGITPQALFENRGSLKDLPKLSLRNFDHFPFVLLKDGHDMRRRANALFEAARMTPEVAFCVDQLVTSCAFTFAQSGCSFVTDTLFAQSRYPDDVILYRLEEEGTERRYSLLHKRGKLFSGAMRAFLTMASEE